MDAAVEPLKGRRLYLLLRERILNGDLPPGTRLPSEPALADEHGVSRVTVRRALDSLQAERLIDRRPGAGTFVRGQDLPRPIVADLADVFSHIAEMGRSTSVKLLSFAYLAPSQAIAEALGLAPGERVQRSVRVRTIDGAPFSHLTTYVPERIGTTYSEADLAATPLLGLLDRSGIVTERASQTIGATLAGPEIAEHLQLEIGSPLLSVTRIVFEPTGKGVEYLHALYRPDRYSFRMDLVRTGKAGARRWSAASAQPQPSKPSASKKPARSASPDRAGRNARQRRTG